MDELGATPGAQPAALADKDDDNESEESFIENAINQNPGSITLSVYDKKNMKHK